jgi:hypothetical protein
MSDNILRDLSVPTPNEYIEICRRGLSNDLDSLFKEFKFLNMTSSTEYSEARCILTTEIRKSLASKIQCETLANLNDGVCDSCTVCRYRLSLTETIHKLNNKNTTNRARNPPYTDFWTSYYPIVVRLTYANSSRDTGDFSYKLFLDDVGTFHNKISFFNTLIRCYDDIISRHTEMESSDDDNIMSYLAISDFMNRYSELISRIVIYTKSPVGYGAIMCNFKRWWRIEPDFQKKITNTSEYRLINGLKNALKRKENMNSCELDNILMTIIVDFSNLKSDADRAGIDGFLIAARLRMPSMVEAFRQFVDDDTVRSVLDPIKLRESKTHTIQELTTKKIVRFLRHDL